MLSLFNNTAAVSFPVHEGVPSVACEGSNINSCRTVWNIVTSCLITIFISTWISIHPNISYPVEKRDMKFWAKRFYEARTFFLEDVFLFTLTVFYPEYILAWAVRQWRVATQMVKYAGMLFIYFHNLHLYINL